MASYSLSAFKIRLINSILYDNFAEGVPLDRAYAAHFRKIKLEPGERMLIVALVNDLIRRLNYYSHIAGYNRPKDARRHINRLICALHVENRWPAPRDLPDCADFSEKQAKIRREEAREIPNLRYGCPEWLDRLGRRELGERWDAEKIALSREPDRYVRTNTLKVTRERLRELLLAEGVACEPAETAPDALKITGAADLFKTQLFRDGLFEQQDIASQAVAPLLRAGPGMRVVDACAGAGGKTLHLAALMRGKGVIIAMDDKEWKLRALRERARRAGAFNIETRLIESAKTIKRLRGTADRVLLDVPCSGTGVLRRNFDGKWQDRTAEILELAGIQAGILDRYSQMTKEGGLLLYSTCSILPAENERRIEEFLETHPWFELEEMKTSYPSEGGDGFFTALLKRVSAGPADDSEAERPESEPEPEPEPEPTEPAEPTEPTEPAGRPERPEEPEDPRPAES